MDKKSDLCDDSFVGSLELLVGSCFRSRIEFGNLLISCHTVGIWNMFHHRDFVVVLCQRPYVCWGRSTQFSVE